MMTESDPDQQAVAVRVRVVRTGGFAGLRREWTAEPPPEEAPHWLGLIDECPWSAVRDGREPTGADRFVWRISVRVSDEPARSAQLGDDDLTGPWHDLVDEVREFGKSPPAR